ncbi:MAG TPA: homocysteine S-methyltransferase family protein [Gemmatimonadales bacterium]|jgi:S-methylmethionine-dependent homocysteine/selenocysteine methylase
MPRFRSALPQLSNDLFVTDGGIETTLIFHDGFELPSFAAFVLLEQEKGIAALGRYFASYLDIASRHGTGIVLESPTWRANPDWGRSLGYSKADLADLNRRAIAFIAALRDHTDLDGRPVVLSGNIGPRGDGYVPSALMSAAEAADYHSMQIEVFAGTEADMVSAFTINYVEEAIGVAGAARSHGMPAVISFTVETDGRLPTGDSLQAAIERTDEATDGHVAYYMINCAHPTHFLDTLAPEAAWLSRIRGVRPNASRMSHAELNDATELDQGDPAELGRQCRDLRQRLPALNVLGGCCGTDQRHVDAMVASALLSRAA